MTIAEAHNKEQWDHFQKIHGNGEFLQSWEWGAFQASVGNQPLRMQLIDGNHVVEQLQGIIYALPLGLKFVYVPRYTLCNGKNVDYFLEYFQDQKFVFARLESAAEAFQRGVFNYYEVKNRQPHDTLILDIRLKEEELLEEMHSKTRYNIRLAQKKSVRVDEKKDIELFWQMNEQTAARDKFKSYSQEYYKKMLLQSGVYQFNAYVGDECIASSICIGFGQRFTYLHGASSNEFRNVMAPYLLQWNQIQFAKAHGYTEYDFSGVAPEGKGNPQTSLHTLTWQVDHPLTGVSRFKAGFGGARKMYAGAVEVVLRKRIYSFIRFLKNIVS